MLSRFIRRLKNRAFKQKRQPQEIIETDLSWIWQPFESASNSEFSSRVKKVAAAIIESSADDIPTIAFELDPRLVIPLCAIQLQNEINLTQLSSFKNELESVSIENLDTKIEFVDRVLSKITPKQRWLYLFKSLTPELQFALLSRLINYRLPTRNDWRNLFKKIEYQFKKSREYLGVLTVVFLLSLGSIIEIFATMFSQAEIRLIQRVNNWMRPTIFDYLMAIAIVVVLFFLIILLQEFKAKQEKSEPTLLLKFGLLGIWTFCQEWQRLLRKNLVWEGITIYSGLLAVADMFMPISILFMVALIVIGSWVLAVESALSGDIVGIFTAASCIIFQLMFTLSQCEDSLSQCEDSRMAVAVAVAGNVAVAAVATAVSVRTVLVAMAPVSLLWMAVGLPWSTCFILSYMVYGDADAVFGEWMPDLGDSRSVRFLSILAFPWFCWFPIVFGFTSFALYHRLSWEWRSISLFWLVIFGICTFLWVRGKKLAEKARNPLRSILNQGS